MSVIEVNGLTRRYGDIVAVERFNLRFESGEGVAILGPEGAVQTTVVEIPGLGRSTP